MTLRIEPGPTDDDNRWPCCEHCHEPWSVRLTPFHHDEPCEARRKEHPLELRLTADIAADEHKEGTDMTAPNRNEEEPVTGYPCCRHCDEDECWRLPPHDRPCPECWKDAHP